MKRLISDNYVTGDNIYLRELQNFFFEVLGMMSITHYGAIGDGRRDNYGPLQVAIDDANRRGLSFLYVPYGKFIYTGELQNIGNIVFMGNPHAKIVNIRTAQEIPILQFGLPSLETFYTKEEADERFYTEAETESKVTSMCYTKEQIDTMLANYYTKTQTDALLAEKQNKLIAGDNIKIVGNTISAVDQAFFSCPFPTSWSGTDTSKTGTNDYGTWALSTDGSPYSGHNIGEALDGDLTTYWGCDDGVTDLNKYILLELPTDVSIRPTQLELAYKTVDYTESPATFQGYNPDSSSWETLYTFDTDGVGSGSWTITTDLNTDKYYTKFRINNVHAKRGYVSYSFYEFAISAGYIKS